ncbi:hypothetical protein GH714_012380 [Hevea brasiliensis]|uniref:Uncharacterized protein n=1 Tax=Hevea brasiliensis TaxID=3981 RepID=A0A6A6N2W7_HEVBR|nr:hypothetical protein GH714_012380 [Hevea brasiliensis]
MKVESKPIFKKIVIESNPPVNYIIGDGMMGFVYDVAVEVGIPAIQLHTTSACAFWTFFSIPDIIAAHELPIKEPASHGWITKRRILYSIPKSVTTNDNGVEEISKEFQEGPKERGYIVKWAPQEEQVNSRFVSEVSKLGLDMKDVCDRKVVEKMVNDLMVDRREEFVESTARMAELARMSVSEGGSSSCCLDRLIKDIRLMNRQAYSTSDD